MQFSPGVAAQLKSGVASSRNEFFTDPYCVDFAVLCPHTSSQFLKFKPPIPHQIQRKLATLLYVRAATPGIFLSKFKKKTLRNCDLIPYHSLMVITSLNQMSQRIWLINTSSSSVLAGTSQSHQYIHTLIRGSGTALAGG